MHNNEQEVLLADLRNRNARSFDALYKLYNMSLFNLAYRLTGNVTDSEDILQETFLKVYESIDQFKGDSALFTWIYSICLNLCYRYLENKKRLTFENMNRLIFENSGRDYHKDRYSEKEWYNYVNQVREGCLFALVRCLPVSQRTAFVLHILLKIPLSSVAKILGKTNGSTRVLICRGRQKIKNFLCTHCSLFGESNRCNCMNFVDYSLRKGLISPYQYDRSDKPSPLPELIQKEISDLKKMLRLYGDLHDIIPSSTALAKLRSTIKNSKVGIFIHKKV